MLFKSAFPIIFLLVSAALVLAVPSSRYDARVVRRREGRQSQFNNRLERPVGITRLSDSEYSVNWAGALWDEANGTFTSVTGTFTVPSTVSGESGAAASAWVGIDGDTCMGGGLLQTGVDFTLSNGDVDVLYDAWYEWYPDFSHDFSGINISAGDVIKLTVSASSTKFGKATIENLTSGKTVTQSLNSSYALCGQSAEWIVEDFLLGEVLVPFANFGMVTFTDAEATGSKTRTPSGATIVNIQQNSQTLTSVSINGSSVTITYV